MTTEAVETKTIRTRYHTLYFSMTGCRTAVYGRNVHAVPHNTPHYHVIAHRCGYQDNILDYCQEHELAHCVVAEFVRDKPSMVMLRLADIAIYPMWDILAEELFAQALQRFVRANEEPIISDCDWTGMKQVFLGYLQEL